VLTRRRALGLGAAALGIGTLGAGSAAVWTGARGDGPLSRGILGVAAGGPAAVEVGTHRMHSAARGRDVDLVTMVPTGTSAERLPVCLVLHGRRQNARGMLELGLPRFLEAAARSGGPTFALAAVDGGDSYWVARTPRDDPQAMLRTELPGWLSGLGLRAGGGAPRAVLGISMGCFGALVYARGRLGPGVPTVAVLSPALFRSWPDARSVHAFAGRSAWASTEPLLNPTAVPRLGVWCGREDPFYLSARQLAAATPGVRARFGHGGHTDQYWRTVLPDALGFIGGGR
jgi:S-formylglutathione hydrolase FrmB